MTERIRILLLEDVATDAELVLAELQQGGLSVDVLRVSDEASFLNALSDFAPDIVLADYRLPGYDGLTALAACRARAPGLPFIFVSGSLGEERAVAALKAGATDYVLKDRQARLPAAIQRALAERSMAVERLRIAGELDAERQLTRAVLDTVRAVIVVLDGEGRILHLNPTAQHVLGRPRDSALGAPFWETFIAAEAGEGARQRLRDALDWGSFSTQRPWRASTAPGRRILWSIGVLGVPGPRGERLVLCGLDVTDQEEAEQRAFYLAHFDGVTGLPNRAMFLQRISQHLQARPEESMVAVMMLSLARLQELRDNWGDDTANQVLVQTAHRLRAWQPVDDLLARTSDTSMAVAVSLGDESELSVLVPYILDQLRQPLEVDGRQWFLPVYAGVALYPRDATDPGMLLQSAEAALHRAEGDDVRGYAFYTPLLSDEARERLQLESELRQALQRDNELVLYYQPQIEVTSGRVVGVEALLRWCHPRLGVLTPARFIAIAEVSGLMPQIGRWALREACRQMQLWLRNGAAPLTMSVNLSASQFADANLLTQIESALQTFGVHPGQIELELTESASMRDPQATIAIMQSLSRMGVRLAIDDFGTGYSNLSYLKRFPVDRLKLDQAFVREITADPNDLAISRAVIAMARQLRLEVVAEGVETEGQLALLQQAGCDVVQGYLYSRPVPHEECALLFEKGFAPPGPRRSGPRTVLLQSDSPAVTEPIRQALSGANCELIVVERPRDAFELMAVYEVAAVLADPDTQSTDGEPFLQRMRALYPDSVCLGLGPRAGMPDGGVESLPPGWEAATLRQRLDDAFALVERRWSARRSG